MPRFKPRSCQVCGSQYRPTGPAAKFCPPCAEAKRKEVIRRGNLTFRTKKGDPTIGVGKGGSNKRFTDNPQYKNGIGNFHRLKRQMRAESPFCERCDKDLTNASKYEWCVHHRDHNRTNNVRENLEMLCKRCHQIEHECVSAFK